MSFELFPERHCRYLTIAKVHLSSSQAKLIEATTQDLKMAFSMRQPFRLTSTIGFISKSAFKSTPIRSFHQARPAANFFTSKTTTPISTLVKARNAFKQSRTYMQPATSAVGSGNLIQKLLVGGAIFGGTLVVRTQCFVLTRSSLIFI